MTAETEGMKQLNRFWIKRERELRIPEETPQTGNEGDSRKLWAQRGSSGYPLYSEGTARITLLCRSFLLGPTSDTKECDLNKQASSKLSKKKKKKRWIWEWQRNCYSGQANCSKLQASPKWRLLGHSWELIFFGNFGLASLFRSTKPTVRLLSKSVWGRPECLRNAGCRKNPASPCAPSGKSWVEMRIEVHLTKCNNDVFSLKTLEWNSNSPGAANTPSPFFSLT